jgi:hypothetical protein
MFYRPLIFHSLLQPKFRTYFFIDNIILQKMSEVKNQILVFIGLRLTFQNLNIPLAKH